MKPNKHYVVIKPIPLAGGGSIPLNASVYRTQGVLTVVLFSNKNYLFF